MTTMRLIYYVLNPFTDDRRPIGALLQAPGGGVRVVRAPHLDLPPRARLNVEHILRDVEAAPSMHALPIGAGPQTVVGEVRHLPPLPIDPADWIRDVFFAPLD